MESDKSEIPDILYTYKKISDNTYHQILKEYLWASPPTEFNDIFDCAANNTLLKKLFIRELHREIPDEEINSSVKKLLSNHRIVCFSRNNNNPTMWAHYADNYSGVCIGWDISSIISKIRMVRYIKNIDNASSIYNSLPRGNEFWMSVSAIKLDTWKYENEYRYIDILLPINEDTAKQNRNIVSCKIDNITFGLKTPHNVVEVIKALLDTKKRYQIKKYRLLQNDFTLQLTSKEYTE